jgi:FMN-dependent NADH-azoreductase
MKILRIHCSPRVRESESHRLADAIVAFLTERYPAAAVVDRRLAQGTISHVDGEYADVLGGHGGSEEGSAAKSLAESERLIQELEAADCVVIGTPMHNYTVPSALKAWVDHVVRVHRTFRPTPQGKVGTLRDRPVYVAVSSGSLYSSGRSRQPDFLTPYLTAVLNTIGLRDLHFFSVQGTAFGAQARGDARSKVQQELADHFAALAAA